MRDNVALQDRLNIATFPGHVSCVSKQQQNEIFLQLLLIMGTGCLEVKHPHSKGLRFKMLLHLTSLTKSTFCAMKQKTRIHKDLRFIMLQVSSDRLTFTQ